MNLHLPHLPDPKGPRAQLALIMGKFLLVLLLVALVVASVVQQRQQHELQQTQRKLAAVQLESNLAHNDNACAMRTLTHTLISRTRAALKRPTTRPQDKPGFRLAITAYTALHDRQVTVPRDFACESLSARPSP